MKHKMSILERILTLNLLPGEGNVVTLRVVRDMQNKLAPSAEEISDWKIGPPKDEKGKVIPGMENQVSWDKEKAQEKEIELSDAAMGIIKLRLKKLDEDKKLTPQLLVVFEKFIMEEKSNENNE